MKQILPNTSRIIVWSMVALMLISQAGCKRFFSSTDTQVEVNPKDPRSPQYTYRMEEFGLLQIASDNIQTMEQKKQYGEIYDRYGSKAFKKSLERRDFLKMAHCAETHLGEIIEFDRMNLGFVRKGKKAPLDILTRRVRRARGEIFEQLIFVGSGVDFKMNGLYWITTNNRFLECIGDVSKEARQRAREIKSSSSVPTAESTTETSDKKILPSPDVEAQSQPKIQTIEPSSIPIKKQQESPKPNSTTEKPASKSTLTSPIPQNNQTQKPNAPKVNQPTPLSHPESTGADNPTTPGIDD